MPLTLSSAQADVPAGQMTVVLTAQSPNSFLSLVGIRNFGLKVMAQARTTPGKLPICFAALNPSASPALSASGSAGVNASSCDVWVNSASSDAVSLSGAASIKAAKVCVNGEVNARKSDAISPAALDCGAKPDPFAGLAPNTPPGCDFNDYSAGTSVTLSPGVYCGGLRLGSAAKAIMSPGVYVIRNGPLTVSGSSALTGDGVVFVLEGSAQVDLSGSGDVRLTAPSSGPLAGFVMFQRPSASPGATAILSGGSDAYFEGVLYFPTQTVAMSGSAGSSTPSPFSAFVADKFQLSGSSSINIGYDPTKTTVPVPPALMTGVGSVVLVR